MSTLQSVIMMGLFAVVFAAVAKLVNLNRNMYNEITSKYNIDEVNSQVYLQLLDQKACAQTFSGVIKSGPDEIITDVLDSLGVTAFTTALSPIYSKNVIIESMVTDAYALIAPDPAPYNAEFRFTLTYSVPFGEGGGARKKHTRDFKIRTVAASWADGTPLANSTNGCFSTGAPNGSGFSGYGDFISKKVPDTKSSKLTMDGAAGSNIILTSGDALLTGVFSISDKQAKENISSVNNSSKMIQTMEPYHFKWKNGGRAEYGFMAQDLEKILPEVVEPLSKNGPKGIAYTSVIPILWESTKEMEVANEVSRKHILDLENRLNKLEGMRSR